jgi:pilus assembly protein CpaE
MSESFNIRLDVLLVSRRKDTLDELESILRKQPGVRAKRKLVVNGHVDPLHGVDTPPDALILHLGETWQAELESLAACPADRRPPLIVVGSAIDTNAMRRAMQAGARDLLPLPLVAADLLAALARIARDRQATNEQHSASLTAFMNAKGGCGATLLACNVAYILAAVSAKRTALIDLDLQFGSIPLYFDLFPKRGVLQALQTIDELDETALDAYLIKHPNGLKILGPAAEDAIQLETVAAASAQRLLDLLSRNHEHVIVDLPRRIDPIARLVIEHAQQFVLTVQQSVATLRDATRLMNCLRHELGVGKERIVVVVNRYDKRTTITAEDIRKTLGCGELTLIPNDFRTVSECIDSGKPLCTHARGAPITKAVMELETRLGGNSASDRPGLFSRTLSNLIKPRSV